MSEKSGIAAQVISLPQGGGAVKGIGETFSPDPLTGTARFTVPLELPPGRHGFQPDLKLTYSSGAGNGPFGLGWELSVPGVSRKTSSGVPRYHDEAPDPAERDTFLLSGAEDLVPIAGSAGLTRFRPRTEGLFARIERVRDATSDAWSVRTRDGLTSVYGTPGQAGRDPAAVADPRDRTRVAAWRLSRVTDPFGSVIEYDYLRDTGQDGSREWDQLYLAGVRYVDHGSPGQQRFLASVRLQYGERPDPHSSHRARFEVRTRLRCRGIEVWTHADEERLIRRWDLVYVDERVASGELPASRLPANGVSLLSQIRVSGHDGDQVERMPPLEFGYTPFDPARRRRHPVSAGPAPMPPHSLSHPDLETVDLFGDGLPDIVQMNGGARFWRNRGDGVLDPPLPLEEVPAGVHLGDQGVRFADLDGNGRADLLVQPLGGYFPMGQDGRWSAQGFVRYRYVPTVPLDAPDVRMVDLDGDGVVDALRTGAAFELFYSDPVEGWSRVESVPRQPLDVFPDLTFADPRVKLGDLSGDGLQDMVLVQQGRIDYWPYLGEGRWGRRVTMSRCPVFQDPSLPPGQFDPHRVLLGDVDGDGVDDIVYVQPYGITVWINRSGNGWSDPIPVPNTPALVEVDAVRVADVLGSGAAGVLWTVDQAGQVQRAYDFLDLTGGVKPYLLDEMDNHMGATTRVRYEPSTRFRQADAADPGTAWRTPLPFPVQVVAAVEVIDALSQGKLVTEYRYHHGYWDGAEREFRGFGMVEQLDTQTFGRFGAPGLHGEAVPFAAVPEDSFAPPLLTRTWFHMGPVGDERAERREVDLSGGYWKGDPQAFERDEETRRLLRELPVHDRADALRALRGTPLRVELYAQDGSAREALPYTVTETLTGVREVDAPGPGAAGRRRVFFPRVLARRTTDWERGDDPMTRLVFTEDHDRYGQPLGEVQVACPRGWRLLATSTSRAYLVTRTQTDHAVQDGARYMVDRVAVASTYEIRAGDEQPERTVPELLKAIRAGTVVRRLIAQTLNHYDGPPFVGLAPGKLGPHGALVRTERLAFTREALREAYGGLPPYLDQGAPWTAEYPPAFRDQLPPLAGYLCHPCEGTGEPGYFASVLRRRHDFQSPGTGAPRGLVLAERDPFGKDGAMPDPGDTTIEYDRFGLLAVAATAPSGLVTRARYDYRTLQPAEVIDCNGNLTRFTYSPLGLLHETWLAGKPGVEEGDRRCPSVTVTRDQLAFAERGQPVSLRTLRRVHHDADTGALPDERDRTIETREHFDGFGRCLQVRTQGEEVRFGDDSFGGGVLPADQDDAAGTLAPVTGRANLDPVRVNVNVSGWQVHDNKGRVVAAYEPFRDEGWDYAPPDRTQVGQRTSFSYDPLGRLQRTVHPDGSEQSVVYGVPGSAAEPRPQDPATFEPTPWDAYLYDANDNAGRTHPQDAPLAASDTHQDTPASVRLDALGRPLETVERSRPSTAAAGSALEPVQAYRSCYAYDAAGRLREVRDQLDRSALRYTYDAAGRELRRESIDAGVRRFVRDAAGSVIEERGAGGALVLRAYDRLQRQTRLWARDATGQQVTLRERLVYGDSPDAGLADAAQRNLGGRVFRHYDEAGLLVSECHDLDGNLVERARRVIADRWTLSAWAEGPPDGAPVAFRVDWQAPPGVDPAAHEAALLEDAEYRTTTAYDALGRARETTSPSTQDGTRRVLRLRHNQAGALIAVELSRAGQPAAADLYVRRVAYDARGRRILVIYGNHLMTRYAYDHLSSRLVRLRTEACVEIDPLTYRPTGPVLQDHGYEYDLTGNLLALHDRAPASGLPGQPDRLDRAYAYDALYRLVSASGRECGAGLPDALPYREEYRYDAAGNVERVDHLGGEVPSSRAFTLVAGTNRLLAVTSNTTTAGYAYDATGNLVAETPGSRWAWDHAGRLAAQLAPCGESPALIHIGYLYDAAGRRIRKLAGTGPAEFTETTYVDGLFERTRLVRGETVCQNDRVHVMDDRQRIAVLRVGPALPGEAGPAVQYHLGDHLGSSVVVAGGSCPEAGELVGREEYTPFGETCLGSFPGKRYRFTGQERDDESGLYYHGSRYYAPWLARWISPDPQPRPQQANLYVYGRQNPLRFVDPSGTQDNLSGLERMTGWNLPADTRWQLYGYGLLDAASDEQTYVSALDMEAFFLRPEDVARRPLEDPMTGSQRSPHEQLTGQDLTSAERQRLFEEHRDELGTEVASIIFLTPTGDQSTRNARWFTAGGQVRTRREIVRTLEREYALAGGALVSPGGTAGYAIAWALGADKYQRMHAAEAGATLASVISAVHGILNRRRQIRESLEWGQPPLEVPGARAPLKPPPEHVAPAPPKVHPGPPGPQRQDVWRSWKLVPPPPGWKGPPAL